MDEPELIQLIQSLLHSPPFPSPSSVSSASTDINTTFPPLPTSLRSSFSSTSSPPSVFIFPPSFRWLLPPGYDTSSVVWLPSTNTSPSTSLSLASVSPATSTQQSDIETVAEALFHDIRQEAEEEMHNDPEFLRVLEEWHKEIDSENQLNTSLKTKNKQT